MGILQVFLRNLGWSWGFKMTGYTLMKLQRLDGTDKGMFGHLEWDNFDCVTLERHDTLIPEGLYDVEMYDSPHFGCKVPEIKVPGRTHIEIHWANWETQLEGCVAVGENRSGFAIEHSKDTFREMMAKWPLGKVQIKIC